MSELILKVGKPIHRGAVSEGLHVASIACSLCLEKGELVQQHLCVGKHSGRAD